MSACPSFGGISAINDNAKLKGALIDTQLIISLLHCQ